MQYECMELYLHSTTRHTVQCLIKYSHNLYVSFPLQVMEILQWYRMNIIIRYGEIHSPWTVMDNYGC